MVHRISQGLHLLYGQPARIRRRAMLARDRRAPGCCLWVPPEIPEHSAFVDRFLDYHLDNPARWRRFDRVDCRFADYPYVSRGFAALAVDHILRAHEPNRPDRR